MPVCAPPREDMLANEAGGEREERDDDDQRDHTHTLVYKGHHGKASPQGANRWAS